MTNVLVRPFRPDDQQAVHAMILAGLGEHFKVIDPSLNPDLDDIWTTYAAKGSSVLVAVDGNNLVGTGTLIREAAGTGRIVRMSVAADQRRRGIGRLLVRELLAEGRKAGYTKIVLETNDDWHGAIRMYRSCGFRPYKLRGGEIHLRLDLTGS